MMTTFAALFGALPLAFGTGEGSELRHPLGITIVGGLIVSQVLTLYTTPVVFIYLDNFGKWLRACGAAIMCARRRADGGSAEWSAGAAVTPAGRTAERFPPRRALPRSISDRCWPRAPP